MNFKCPICNTPLIYYSYNEGCERFECPKCNHLIMANYLDEIVKNLINNNSLECD